MKIKPEPIQGIRFREFTLEEYKREMSEANCFSKLIEEAIESGKPVFYDDMIICAEHRDVMNKYNQPERIRCISIKEIRKNDYE